jgi:hypothetical protein
VTAALLEEARNEAKEWKEAYDDIMKGTSQYGWGHNEALPVRAEEHPTGQAFTDLLRDKDLADREAIARADGRSHMTAPSDFGGDQAHTIRKEASEVKIMGKLPTVPGLPDWKIAIANALVQASAYGDRAEIAWFKECSDPEKTFEYFGNSGADRFTGLDNKLASAITPLASQNPSFKRELDRVTRQLFSKSMLPTGRQVCHLLFHSLKTDSALAG